MLEANAIVGAYPHVRVHVETGDLCASLAHDRGLGVLASTSQAQDATALARTRGDQSRIRCTDPVFQNHRG
jgi:hypothetical protein